MIVFSIIVIDIEVNFMFTGKNSFVYLFNILYL